MAEYYRYGHAKGVKAMYGESYANWGEGPKLYVSAQLQWNPEQDVDALLRDWYVRAVGEDAADDLAGYYAHWEDFWTRRILASAWFDKGAQFLTYHQNSYLYLLNEDEIHTCRQQLEAVLAKAKTPEQKARAQVFLRAFEYYELTALAYLEDAHSLDKPVTTEEEALASLESGVACCEMAQNRRHLALIELPKNPVLRHAISLELTHDDHRPWMRKWGYRDVLAGTNWGTPALWAAYGFADSETVHDQLVELAQSAANPTVRENARFMLLLSQKKLAPITEDASFEAIEGGQTGLCEFTGGGVGSMEVVADNARSGERCIECRGLQDGHLKQKLSIVPGLYGAVASIRGVDGLNDRATVEISIDLEDANGNDLLPLPTIATIVRPRGTEWVTIATMGEVPAEVDGAKIARAVLNIQLKGFEPDERVAIDDFALYRIPKE
jgi:hypothetical protein